MHASGNLSKSLKSTGQQSTLVDDEIKRFPKLMLSRTQELNPFLIIFISVIQ